ncbi:EamA family transporter [Paenibacillus sp. Marseille-Q4541]|uniref:EamA family transporter n=1 Tax=Paenibacillus sp. Marseille-Q4541 TaxID=2831522 RepID=UPI001BA63905|nr:EamA family transporter [Paenibacillus sp. Marseille-Q4541]
MFKNTSVSYLLLALNILMLSGGQILFKIGLEKMGGVNLLQAWKAIFNPVIFSGLLLYVMATLIWFVVLSRIPLSVAYPTQSIAYILGIVASFYLFNEPVSVMKWLGAIFILIGVVFIATN